MLRLIAKLIAIAALAVFGAAVSAAPAIAQLADVECDGTTYCKVLATGLPLRLLIKPQSNIYIDKDTASQQISSNVPAFSVLYAFGQDGVAYDDANLDAQGWFQVGFLSSGAEGWVQAKDVVPWKQALALAFTNPGPTLRKPVLMFKSKQDIEKSMNDIHDGVSTADALYQAVDSGTAPAEVISRESSSWVDINAKFYLLPILDHEDMSFMATDALGIQLAALTNQGRSDQVAACDIHDANYQQCTQDQQGAPLDSVALDVVFVIDTTSSMQPYIDAVTSAVREAAQALSQKLPNPEALKFGIVGYRDAFSPSEGGEGGAGMEYTSKNFTPELLPADQFRDLLNTGEIRSSDVGSGDWAEDVFAGMKDGIQSNWSPDSARMIILIGDASGHPIGDPKNTTNMSEVSIKELADQEKVYIASIYVGGEDLAEARPQFEGMSAGSGDEGAVAFAVVDDGGESTLEQGLQTALQSIMDVIGSGKFASVKGGADDSSVQNAILPAVRAAFVDYLGSDAQPPSNITAWVLDRDPTDPENKKAFDVKVMVQKGEMQELKDLVQTSLAAFQGGQTNSGGFLDDIIGGSGAASYDLGVSNAQKIGDSPNIPKWIKALPYKSPVLTISQEEFTQMAPDDRTSFEERLNNLIQLYDADLNNTDQWVALNDEASAEDKVFMLDIKELP